MSAESSKQVLIKIPTKSQEKPAFKNHEYLNDRPLDHFNHVLLLSIILNFPTSTTAQLSTYTYIDYELPHINYALADVTPKHYTN